MGVLRFFSNGLGFFCLSLSILLFVLVLFYFHLVATVPSLSSGVPGNASLFIEQHHEESVAFVQESFELGDVCIEDPSQDICVMVSNTSFLSEQFTTLIPSETFDVENYPEYHLVERYVVQITFIALVLFVLGFVFVFLGYQPEYSAFFQTLSLFFFLEFLLYSLGAFFFLRLHPEQFVSFVRDILPELSPFLVLFVVSLVLPYFQSLVSDFLFYFLFFCGGFFLFFIGIYLYRKKSLNP